MAACASLADRFPGSAHVKDFGLTGDDDERIWILAQDRGFVIVTKDSDFLARALLRGSPPQVVQIVIGNASTREIESLLLAKADVIKDFITAAQESVLILRW